MNEGWISLHRKITEHWIWDDPIKLKWWLDLLLSVNHSDQKVLIGNNLFECKKGQSIMSLQNWGKRWCVSKDSVRAFFELLKKDEMIRTENLIRTTRITICNYEDYQQQMHDKPTAQQTMNPPLTHPNNNENNVNNEKNVNILYSLYPSRCVVKNSSTGKSMKNKTTLSKLLKTIPFEKLEATINWYISECRNNGIYMKNFSTFLNNLPEIPEDYSTSKQIDKPQGRLLQ